MSKMSEQNVLAIILRVIRCDTSLDRMSSNCEVLINRRRPGGKLSYLSCVLSESDLNTEICNNIFRSSVTYRYLIIFDVNRE